MPKPNSEYTVLVGRIAQAHGLRGEVRVIPLSDVPGRFQTLKEVLVQGAKSSALLTVQSAREGGRGTWLLRFQGLEDRTAIEPWRGAALLVREDDSPALPEGSYYLHQIVGLEVVTTDGRHLGPITEVLETGANDVYVTAAGLIPATREVIKKIDLAAGTMLIEPLPGMLEEAGADDAG